MIRIIKNEKKRKRMEKVVFASAKWNRREIDHGGEKSNSTSSHDAHPRRSYQTIELLWLKISTQAPQSKTSPRAPPPSNDSLSLYLDPSNPLNWRNWTLWTSDLRLMTSYPRWPASGNHRARFAWGWGSPLASAAAKGWDHDRELTFVEVGCHD